MKKVIKSKLSCFHFKFKFRSKPFFTLSLGLHLGPSRSIPESNSDSNKFGMIQNASKERVFEEDLYSAMRSYLGR